jgi:O-antigen/teichoic acid export membrane protein
MVSEASTDEPPRDGRRSFGFDVLLTVGGKGLFVLFGALLTVLIARRLGPTGQGTFAVAFNLMLMLVQLGSMGLPIANPYFAARDARAQRAIVLHSLRIAIVVAAALAARAAATKAVAPAVRRGHGWGELAVTLAAIPAALATLYIQGVLLGQRRMVAYNLVEVLQVGSALALLVVAFAVSDPGLIWILAIVAAGRYLSLAAALWNVRGLFRGRVPAQPGLVRRMLAHGARVYVVGLLAFVLIRLDLLLVNAVLDAEDAGHYSIAAYVAEGLILIPVVIGTNLVPRIATGDAVQLSLQVFRGLILGWGLVCLGSAPVAAFGIPVVFGDSYDAAIELYLWLIPGIFCMGLLNSLMIHYFVRGYPRGLIAAWVVGLTANVVLNLVLLEPLGVVAASIVSSVTYAAVLAAHVRGFARDVGGYRALGAAPSELVSLVRAAFGRPT